MPWAEGKALFGLAIAHRLSRIGGGGIPLNFQRETSRRVWQLPTRRFCFVKMTALPWESGKDLSKLRKISFPPCQMAENALFYNHSLVI